VRWLVVTIALAACGPKAGPLGAGVGGERTPRLLPPPLLDPDARGAGYLTAVALQLQPGWQQFLEDCRLRLPARHALNQMTLAATVELAIEAHGKVVDVRVASSGNADFDRAVRQVISDAAPLPRPPRELWSDDDRVHLRWQFARDRRQAGPATATIVDVELPLQRVVDRLVAAGDLARAARRIGRAPADAKRTAATRTLMVGALREGLASSESAVRRAAIEAIGTAQGAELAGEVQQLASATSDIDLRLAALASNLAAPEPLLSQLQLDLKTQPQLALAEVKSLVALEQGPAAAAIVRAELEAAPPNPIALQALALVPSRELVGKLGKWFANGDPRVRAAVCTALAGNPPRIAWPLLARGMRDRAASVRAACVDSAREHAVAAPGRIWMLDEVPEQSTAARAKAIAALIPLARDHDRAVRAAALQAIARLDWARLPDASGDRAAHVRAAYAHALWLAANAARWSDAVNSAATKLTALFEDRDPDVRAAAWTAYEGLPMRVALFERAVHAARDSAPQVRRAVLPSLTDQKLLWQISVADDAPDVRTDALVRLARVATRESLGPELLERLAVAPAGSAERVRTALAWLLAR